eukprot:scaffold7340_cov266-Pinguiococcus_pyrenoidosus.AAC.56
MKLAEMRGVHRLIPEDAIDAEILLRREGASIRVHLSCQAEVLEGLFPLEVIAVAHGPESARLVDLLHALVVVLGHPHAVHGILDEKRVMRISCRVGLRLKQRVKVPEAGLDPLVRGHLVETHLHQNLPELGSHFQQRMDEALCRNHGDAVQVERLEFLRLPLPRLQHLVGEVCRLLLAVQRELRPFRHFPAHPAASLHQLTLLEGLEVVSGRRPRLQIPKHLGNLVPVRRHLSWEVVATGLVVADPFVLERCPLGESEHGSAQLLRESGFAGAIWRHQADQLEFRCALGRILGPLLGQRQSRLLQPFSLDEVLALQRVQSSHHLVVNNAGLCQVRPTRIAAIIARKVSLSVVWTRSHASLPPGRTPTCPRGRRNPPTAATTGIQGLRRRRERRSI